MRPRGSPHLPPGPARLAMTNLLLQILVGCALVACGDGSPSPAPVETAPPSAKGPDPGGKGGDAAGGPGRDRMLHAARGAPVQEEPWSGAWSVQAFSTDVAAPGAQAMARALGVPLQPVSARRPPQRGEIAITWLAAGASPESAFGPSAGGALVFAVAPGDPTWRDATVGQLGFAGGGIIDAPASLARWVAPDAGPSALAAGAAVAWELAHHYPLAAPLGPAGVADAGLLGVVLGGEAPGADAAERAWAARAGRGTVTADEPDPAVRLGALAGGLLSPAALAADPEPLVRARALDGSADVAALRRALDDPSSVVRLVAAQGLARLAFAGDASPPLRAALADAATRPGAYLRWKAAHALGAVPGSVDVLAPLLQDPDIDVRRAAARSLGRQRDPAAIPALEAALDDPNSFVRQWVARGLLAMQHPATIPALEKAARDQTALVAEVAARGLAALGQPVRVQPYRPPPPGDPAVLERMATGADGTARKDALKLLAGTPRGTVLARAALTDADSEVRKQAVEGLGWAEEPVPALLPVLRDRDPDVLVTTLIALRRQPVAGGAAAIAPLTRHADPEIQLRAAQALAALATAGVEGDGDARAALQPLRAHPDERTRAAALSALPDALQPDEPSVLVRRAAAGAGAEAPCAGSGEPLWVRSACPDAPGDLQAAALGLLALEDDLLHLRASWTHPDDRPQSHRALRPPVLRPYGDPDRG